MNRRLTRPAAALGALALSASTLLLTATAAQAAPGDGVLTVNIVDQYDRPVTGVVQGYDSSGNDLELPSGGQSVAAPSTTFVIPAGGGTVGASFTTLSPWSGADCFGVTPCAVGGGTSWTPVVLAPEGTNTVYTLRVTVPSITGGGTTGSPLTLQMPAGTALLNSAFAASGPPFNSLSTAILQQWTRGAADIAGATGASYTTVREDGGTSVAARLTPSPAVSGIFGLAFGYVPQPFTTNSIAVAKAVPVKTKTKVGVPKRFKATEKVTMNVKVKASAGMPDGTVTVSIGKFKTKKTLKDGKVLVNLPRLAAGTYRVKVAYSGSEEFVGSKAKKVTITVTK